jgi:RNA polymerase sigma-70 factor, ECF subfamily
LNGFRAFAGGDGTAIQFAVMSATQLDAFLGAKEFSATVESQRRYALLQNARGGDRDALASLLMPYASGVYRAGLRLTGNVFDAEDVQQETLLKAFARLAQFTGAQTDARDDLRAWVSRIATNTSIDVIRRRRDGKLFSLDQPAPFCEESLGSQIPSRQADPEQGFLRHERRRILAAAISELPPELRKICLLLDVLHYTTQEVAQRLGVSNVAVRLRLFRAHRRLREKLYAKLSASSRPRPAAAKPHSSRGNRRSAPCPTIAFAYGGD